MQKNTFLFLIANKICTLTYTVKLQKWYKLAIIRQYFNSNLHTIY